MKKTLSRLLVLAVTAITATTMASSTATAGANDWLPEYGTLTHGVTLTNLHSNLCLIPYGGSDDNGANIVQFACNGSKYERWYSYGPYQQIRNEGSHKCMTPYGGEYGDDINMTQWDCDTSVTQGENRYYSYPGNTNWFEIKVVTDKCLTVRGAWTVADAQITQYTCSINNEAQYWHMT